jgi:hypothetical protein
MMSKSANSLDKLVGMSQIKTEIQALINTYQSLKQRSASGGNNIRLSMNSLIIGNTGTG